MPEILKFAVKGMNDYDIYVTRKYLPHMLKYFNSFLLGKKVFEEDFGFYKDFYYYVNPNGQVTYSNLLPKDYKPVECPSAFEEYLKAHYFNKPESLINSNSKTEQQEIMEPKHYFRTFPANKGREVTICMTVYGEEVSFGYSIKDPVDTVDQSDPNYEAKVKKGRELAKTISKGRAESKAFLMLNIGEVQKILNRDLAHAFIRNAYKKNFLKSDTAKRLDIQYVPEKRG